MYILKVVVFLNYGMEHLILKLSCYGDHILGDGYMQAVIVKMAGCNRYLVSAVPLATACRHSPVP